MDYKELAKEFLHNSYRFRSQGHQKRIDENMQGETFAIAFILRQGGVVLPSDISNEMNISSARVAAILNSLENKKLITRKINKSDRRKILVELTEEGKLFAEDHSRKVVESTAKMLELLGEDDARDLVRIIRRLAGLGPQILKNKSCSP